MNGTNKKAFNYDEGQFICHVFATISEEGKLLLKDVTRLLQEKQRVAPNSRSFKGWTAIDADTQDGDHASLHITLLRGHRAIYYHQIKHLVEALVCECKSIAPFCVCLDDLRVFNNLECTKQFLSLSSRENFPSTLKELKSKLRLKIDQFATKLSSEDETDDTLPHCSFMSRQAEACDQNELLKDLNSLYSNDLDEYPICVIKIENIYVKIGKCSYKIDLTG